jgi:hypothetical protein
MNKFLLKTPVLFLIFNRPDTTLQVFEQIRQAKPPRLYVAADGPRVDYKDDMQKITLAREIATKIDWPCKLKTLFRDKNLGCKKAISESITWFFDQEEQGIILEDDCLPHFEFFSFCEILLNRYANNQKVFAITGNNFQNNVWRGEASYYYSKYMMCWGWASWRRAWNNYQVNMPFWPEWSKSKEWLDYTPDKIERKYWKNIFERMFLNKIDTWDYQWVASIWYKGGLTITPNVNLVSNIGFGKDATNTKSQNDKFSRLPVNNIGDLKYPKKFQRNIEADNLTFNYHYGGKNLRFPFSWIIFPKRVLKYLISKVKTMI